MRLDDDVCYSLVCFLFSAMIKRPTGSFISLHTVFPCRLFVYITVSCLYSLETHFAVKTA